MDIQEKETLIAEIERFKEEAMKSYVVSCWAESYTNYDPFEYVVLENKNNKVWWLKTQAYQLWEMWQAAKAQAVPAEFEIGRLKDQITELLDERQDLYAQINAQAVPEGLVLVKNVHPDAIVHNQGLGLFKECQIIYGWDGKSKDFKDALNKGFYHGVKLGAKAVLETAMIEEQEPAND